VAEVISGIDCDDGRTEIANGQRFAHRFSSLVRWCPTMKSWLAWDGQRWAVDSQGRAEICAKAIYRSLWDFIAQATHEKDGPGEDTINAMVAFAKATGRAQGIENMLKMARSEPGIPVCIDGLDCDPWLLNVQNGTIDLRTAVLRPHSQNDLLTKLCPVAYDPSAGCPVWLEFLHSIMGGNEDLIRFLQHAAGMSISGVIRDHALIVLYGTGQNGKSTFLNALQSTIGLDYSMKAPLGMLMAKGQETHPTERADLFGRRFVTCIEVDDGQRLAESLIKELTGGDRIRARFMRQDFFEFVPTHHIWLAVNHRPEIRGTDVGVWRRIKLVPFEVSIPEEDQDKELPEKLQAERPGILAWAVRGAMEWAESGLGEPDEVRKATANYRSEQDVIASFISDRCIVNDTKIGVSGWRVGASDLYAAYTKWCEKTGEYYVKQRRFGEAMTERGFQREHSGKTWYIGIGLQDSETPQND
jgi:putative DNA primase/helicase